MMEHKITISDQEFFYIEDSDCTEFGENLYTQFFQEKEVYKYKKYIIFGPIIEEIYPKVLFTIPYHLTNTKVTKTELRTRLEREVELLKRKDEIEKGELI
jgi:hypothetical protein